MAPPAQRREGTPDYEQWLGHDAEDCDVGLHETARPRDQVRKRPGKYPHSTRSARVRSEGLNWDLAGNAMAYVHFAQILYE
jgi:hypothetical protein